MASALILPLTANGASFWKSSRKSSTFLAKASDASRIFRASSCCIMLSFSLTLSDFFFSAVHAKGASSSCFRTSSLMEMPYVLSNATVATSGSNITSVFSWRLRKSRMYPIISYSSAFREVSSRSLFASVGSFASTSSPRAMNSYSSDIELTTLLER